MKKILLNFLWVLMLLGSQAYAQSSTVTGRVTGSDDGLPLPGVTVNVKGSKNGTQTGADGRFSIVVPSSNSVLVFSFVGFETQESLVRGGTVNVRLVPSVNSLNDVVVVGYGTQKRGDVTGSQSSVRGSDFADRSIPSFDKDLAGRATGVQVINPSGLLGQPAQIRIRGTNTINSGAGPLYVVDGIPVPVNNTGDVGGFTSSNPLADINPNDIESFEILKDGAATAIYGSRAANGVVLINTKRGVAGKTTFTYDGNYATAKVSKRFNLLNASQFIDIANERLFPAASVANQTSGAYRQAFPTPDGNGGFVDTDWQDYIFKTASQQNHSVTASGGTDKGKYFFSLGYSDQKGIIVANSLKRISLRTSLDQKVNKILSVGLTAGLTYQDNKGPLTGGNSLSGDIYGTIRMLPNVTVYNPNDPTGYNINPADRRQLGLGANTLALSDNTPNQIFVLEQNIRRSQTYRLLGNAYVQLDLAPGLRFKTILGVDDLFIDDYAYTDPRHGDGFSSGGSVSQVFTPSTSWDLQNILSYTHSFNSAHNLDVTLVNEFQKTRQSFFQATGTTLSDVFFRENLTSNTFTTPTVSGGLVYRSIESYVGRINYNYKNRYYIGGSLRADRLSQLSPENRLGYFPGVSAAYRISEEPFFKSSKGLSFISDLRIRGSFGSVGNIDIGSFPYLGTYGAAAYGNQSGLGFNQAGNPDLRWEKQNKYDAGIDLGLFDNRINIVTAYYRQDSKDLILQAPTAPSLGVPSNFITRNIGAVRNQGFELQISGEVIRKKNFSWNSTINFSTQKNRVIALVDNQDQFFTLNNSTFNIRRVGEPLNALYGYEYAGVNAANGNPLYVKANGQIIQGNVTTQTYNNYDPANPGVLGAAATLAAGDRKVLGNVLPTYFGGFNNTVTYKAFDLNVFLRFSGGNKIYNRSRVDQLNQNFVNNSTEILGRWVSPTQPGDGITPRQWFGRSNFINLDSQAYTRFVEDGDYLRLANVSVGYKVPASITNALKLSRARLYASAQNLFVITGYKGLDPETNTGGFGVDFNGNPQQRTFTFGVNIGF